VGLTKAAGGVEDERESSDGGVRLWTRSDVTDDVGSGDRRDLSLGEDHVVDGRSEVDWGN
jgi:hypothetical protein